MKLVIFIPGNRKGKPCIKCTANGIMLRDMVSRIFKKVLDIMTRHLKIIMLAHMYDVGFPAASTGRVGFGLPPSSVTLKQDSLLSPRLGAILFS